MAESQLEVTRLKAAQDELQAEQRRAADEASRLRLSERQWQRIAAEQHLVLNRLCRFLLSDQTGSPERPARAPPAGRATDTVDAVQQCAVDVLPHTTPHHTTTPPLIHRFDSFRLRLRPP